MLQADYRLFRALSQIEGSNNRRRWELGLQLG